MKLQGESDTFYNHDIEDIGLRQEHSAFLSDGASKQKSPKKFRDPRAFAQLSERQKVNPEELG